MTKTLRQLLMAALLVPAMMACNPDDRSSEQPFKPTVRNVAFQIEADSCLLTGEVTASPNSSLKKCGFRYGNDTLRTETKSEAPTMQFAAHTKRLAAGRYYAVAFAENGVGKTYAPDTLYFEIPKN